MILNSLTPIATFKIKLASTLRVTIMLAMVIQLVHGGTFGCGHFKPGDSRGHDHALGSGPGYVACDSMASKLNSMEVISATVSGKADTSYVNRLQATMDSVTSTMAEKAASADTYTKSEMDKEFAKKADKYYVDAMLNNTYSQEEAVDLLAKTCYSKADVDALLETIRHDMAAGLALRREREAENGPKTNAGSNDAMPGAGNDHNNGTSKNTDVDNDSNASDDTFKMGVIVGATVPSFLLVVMMIACTTMRQKQDDAGPRARRRHHPQHRARNAPLEQPVTQQAYGMTQDQASSEKSSGRATSIENPTYSSNALAVSTYGDDAYGDMALSANTPNDESTYGQDAYDVGPTNSSV